MADKKCKAVPESSSPGSSLGSNHDVNFKRARYEKPDDLGGVDIETVIAAHVSDEVAPSSLQEAKTSIHALFGSEASNLRQGYIIGEVDNIFVRLSSCNSPIEILRCHEEVNRISENAKIIDQGNQIRDLIRRHDECLSTKKTFESELTNSIQKLKKIEAEELLVKEAEEVARVLRQQYDSRRLAVKRRVSDLKASIERQKKLDVELRQSRVDANQGLLPAVGRAEALNKYAKEGILNLTASLRHFCSKPE
ncbi:hypothetical protein D8674_009031 [Pyrus ussuriensis x Pyrus communis]|uniref:Uncharacterized protein n=1 Tax=Pyrus ussuriensis x Pyrus communis TaxID=2448454 RepID=A0A5N5HZH1_9ROSA|nr:hypothetical protein D8674_009031 [Pyrus ussuriensis x Pyrus communis]